MERFEEYGVQVERVVNCGGIAAKNPLVMQIYADVMGRPLKISAQRQTCALGAAMAGAVVAGKAAAATTTSARAVEGHDRRRRTQVFKPIPKNAAVYDRLFKLYRQLHDAFGVRRTRPTCSGVDEGAAEHPR